jgi:hypothetical protein
MQMIVFHFGTLLNVKSKVGVYLFLGSLHIGSLIMERSFCSNNVLSEMEVLEIYLEVLPRVSMGSLLSF